MRLNADAEKIQHPISGQSIVAEYLYYDLNGCVLHKTSRHAGKRFTQARPDSNNPGGWIPDLKGVNTIVYNLPQVAQAISAGHPVFVVEGEKDCETMRSLGFTATTCPSGAGKWRDRFSDYLANGDVYIIPDNDKIGVRHAYKVAASLSGKARQIKVLDLTHTVPTLQDKGDISDVARIGRL